MMGRSCNGIGHDERKNRGVCGHVRTITNPQSLNSPMVVYSMTPPTLPLKFLASKPIHPATLPQLLQKKAGCSAIQRYKRGQGSRKTAVQNYRLKFTSYFIVGNQKTLNILTATFIEQKTRPTIAAQLK